MQQEPALLQRPDMQYHSKTKNVKHNSKTKISPFIWNFMLEVPEASVPPVEMCCDSSAAGMMVSAAVTL